MIYVNVFASFQNSNTGLARWVVVVLEVVLLLVLLRSVGSEPPVTSPDLLSTWKEVAVDKEFLRRGSRAVYRKQSLMESEFGVGLILYINNRSSMHRTRVESSGPLPLFFIVCFRAQMSNCHAHFPLFSAPILLSLSITTESRARTTVNAPALEM